METLSNSSIEIKVSAHGAELQSVIKNGREYLWTGDPHFWGRHSPVLFPIVGRVYDDVYRYRGKEFHIGQHGFARDMDFKLVERGEDFVKYALETSEESLKLYPCKFRLEIGYRIEGSTVEIIWKVSNMDEDVMHFQIGAHPAFNFKDMDSDQRGYFSFDNPGELEYVIPVGKGCIGREKYILKRDEYGMMPIDTGTFDNDTYTFENGQLRTVILHDTNRKPYVKVEFDSPLVALWSPMVAHRDCPFVCIEPWYGRCDSYGYDGDFSQREWMQTLAPGETFEASYKITVM